MWFDKDFQEISKDKIPQDAQKVGAMLMTKRPQGQAIAMRVHEVKDKTVVVDQQPAGRKDPQLRCEGDRHQVRRDKITASRCLRRKKKKPGLGNPSRATRRYFGLRISVCALVADFSPSESDKGNSRYQFGR